jgi:hypothetical protein
MPRNTLKSIDSDERIQGNPTLIIGGFRSGTATRQEKPNGRTGLTSRARCRAPRRRSPPGMGRDGFLFVRFDRRRFDQREADVVQPFDEALLAEGIDLELDDPAVGTADLLRRQIDGQRRVRAALGVVLELGQIFGRDPDRQDAVLEAIVVEDVGEVGRDHAADAKVEQRPGRVLT